MPGKKRARKLIQLRISLMDIKPEIWRRVIVDSSMTLHQLHRVIQIMFEWLDYHLYDFRVGEERFEAPLPEAEGLDSSRVRLTGLALQVGDTFTYLYDFGDDWHHRITVESTSQSIDPAFLPYVLAGERRGPPEDCGGSDGFRRFLRALRNPRHPEHEETRTWVGEDYDPDVFDLQTVRHAAILASAWDQPGRRRL